MNPSEPSNPQPARDLKLAAPWRIRLFPNHEWALLLVLLIECVLFSVTGSNFLTTSNAFEITRLSVEIGLLALVLTPVIITGGIDLSVGSMMGLAAVVLGGLWRDAHLPLLLAAAVALLIGLAGGALNALLIARLGLPPLIVTLGTFSLFRGVAEGLTRGIENYSSFPASFLFLGQGYVGGLIPAQLFILVAAIAGVGWWLHRTAFGRALYAIGHSPEGARYAGIPVAKTVVRRLCAVRFGGEPGGDNLRRASGPGKIRRWNWFRIDGHHRRGSRRDIDLRWTRHGARHGPRFVRHRGVAEWPALERAAGGTDGNFDRRFVVDYDRTESLFTFWAKPARR